MSTTSTQEFGGAPPTIDELRSELARRRAETEATREHAHALAESQRQVQSLYLLTDRLQRAATIDDIHTAALDAILSGPRCDCASILLYDAAEVMRFVAWRGLSDEYRRVAEGHSPWRPDDPDPTPIGFGDIESVELEPRREPVVPESRRRLRVLIVDDNVDAAESLHLLLGGDGREIAVSHDGQAALDQAAALVPDVVFLDIGLPEVDGYEVARRMRQNPALAGALIVAMTGYGQPDDLKRSTAAGFDRHLVKPVDPETLESLLEQAGKSL